MMAGQFCQNPSISLIFTQIASKTVRNRSIMENYEMEHFLRKNWWLRTNCGVSARSELVRKLSGRNFAIQHIFQQFCLQNE